MPAGELNADLEKFLQDVVDILESKAKEKGYSDGNLSTYKNDLMSFCSRNFSGHALGEITYKAVRYQAKKDPRDLVKIAAWAALLYMEDQSKEASVST
jgi:hypothetical protein